MENKININPPGEKIMNPYLAGFLLGLTLLASFVILGVGLGASNAVARAAACAQSCIFTAHVASSEYFGKWGSNPLYYYLVFMFVGTLTGGAISAIVSGRVEFTLEKGRSFSSGGRIAASLAGGVIAGFASRLASGCTSGQALTGSAMLLSGSLAFLVAVFVGGYSFAYFVRRQWND